MWSMAEARVVRQMLDERPHVLRPLQRITERNQSPATYERVRKLMRIVGLFE